VQNNILARDHDFFISLPKCSLGRTAFELLLQPFESCTL